MRDDIVIVGVGETPPARRSDLDLRALVVQASKAALDDAGLTASGIDGIVTDMMLMPQVVPPQYLAAQLGIDHRYSGASSWGGAGIACMPLVAASAIRQGLADTVLCYFGVDWGSRPGGPYAFGNLFPAKPVFEKPYGFVAQPSYFALWARRYFHEYGDAGDGLAAIAVNQRLNGLRHGGGQQQRPLSPEDYLASPMISSPLRAADCCLISDGACAFVVTTAERARDLKSRPVRVLGGGYASEPISLDDVFTQTPGLVAFPGVAKAARRAFEESGVGVADVDFAEIYDCFTISCLMQIEELGFCGKGEAADFIREKSTTTDGKFPVNTHGGFLAYSYTLGGEHVIEAVRQLRGEAGAAQVKDASVGLVGGLSVPEYGVLLLGR